MSYAVMPLSDYDAACDKVREKVGEKTILFEETDFGYLRSAIFTVEKTGQYLFSFEFSDPSKFDIYSLFYNVPEWEGETSPGIFEIVDNNNATAYLSAGQQYRIFISDHLGLTPKDILKATLSIDGEVVVDFVPSLTIKSGDLADKVDEVYEAGQKAATVTVDQTYTPESPNAQSGKAVAEALEPFDRKYELIETITLAEAVTTITRNAEPNGKAYSFKDVFVKISWNKPTDKKWIIFEISADGKKTSAFRDLFQHTASGAKAISWMRTLSCYGHRLFLFSERNTNLGYAATTAQMPIQYLDSNKPIDTIKIQYQLEMPVGTVIEIWGVRA